MDPFTKIIYGCNRTIFYFITCVLTCSLLVYLFICFNPRTDNSIQALGFFYTFGGLPILVSSISLGINDAISEPIVKRSFTFNTLKIWGMQFSLLMILALIHHALHIN